MGAVTNPLRRFPPFNGLLRFIESQPLPQVEESIPLRILVQLLVFIGIAATDVAASTNNSVWSIPLSAIGAVWAWQARHKRNVLVKFFIAISMIVMLVVFLTNLIGQVEETRLLLARLLIQLQVLHSFDLPRRKDLGYSTVIGLILLGVAGTISQTTVFGLWLLAFLAIALPVLVLDLRSRLGLSARGLKNLTNIGISPSALASLLGLVLVIGMVIFTFLPRLPGLQLRNFPVSVNINVQRQVPPGGIVNPGRSQLQSNSGSGGDNNTETGEGNGGESALLPPLFAPEIDETKSFQIKPELVMRVRSQAEMFWRVMAYDEYTGKGWRVSRNDKSQIRTLRRAPYNYEFYVPPAFNAGLKPEGFKEVVQTYTITTQRFPNLVPAGAIPFRLYFPSEEMDFDSEGSFRAPGPLPEDLTYTVISAVPYRDRTALGKASQEYSKTIRSHYLQLPNNFSPQVQLKAIELLASATNIARNKKVELDNPYEKALFLTQSLKQRFRLQELSLNANSDVASQFIAQGGGTLTHFVTTLVMMLRSIGIPTRYAVGFSPGKFNPLTGLYEVQNIDVSALAEVFFPGYGWFAFDPVPGHDLFPPSVEVDQTFGVLRSFWNWVAGFLPSPVTGFLTIIFEATGRFITNTVISLISWLVELGWAGFVVGAIIISGLGLGIWGLWQAWGWWRDLRRLQKLAPAQRAYQIMLQQLAEQGMPKPTYQTPQEYATRVTAQVSSTQAEAILGLTQAYQDWQYGDRSSPTAYLKSLLQKLRRRSRKL